MNNITNLVENNQNINYLNNKESNETNYDICYEQNHQQKLEYFCRTHNKLCCRACATKIKGLGNGQHYDCNICFVKDIKEESKNKLKQNLIYLENNISLFDSIVDSLRRAYEEISGKKEKLKIRIQKLFTKIRNDINKREDKLLFQVEEIFEKYFFKKNLKKNIDNIINQINISFTKGKIVLNNFNNNDINLISLINDYIIIEDCINNMNLIKENLKNYEKNKIMKIDLRLNEEEINFLINIKNLGNIYTTDFIFNLKNNFEELNDRKYIVMGEKDNKAKKIIEDRQFTHIKGENYLELNKINKIKINILNSKSKLIMVGITQDEKIPNQSLNNINGWYFYCFNSTLYSGPPHNYKNKKTNSDKIVYKEIIIIFDTYKGNLEFILDNNNKIEGYTDIPLDKPFYPSILLYDKNDTIEINE